MICCKIHAQVSLHFQKAPQYEMNKNQTAERERERVLYISFQLKWSTIIKRRNEGKKINIKCTSKRKQNGKHKIVSNERAYSCLEWMGKMGLGFLDEMGKKRWRKSMRTTKTTTTSTKINVICKRARVLKINQQKYPKTLKEYENKLLKPLPAVSVRSFTLGWSVYARQKWSKKNERSSRKFFYIIT